VTDTGARCNSLRKRVPSAQCGRRLRVGISWLPDSVLPIDEPLVAETLGYLQQAREITERGEIPLPLVDSPKCPRCSLVGICLPDETLAARERLRSRRRSRQGLLFDAEAPASAVDEAGDAEGPVRRLVPARDDLRSLYLNTQGLYVGKSGNVLRVKEKETHAAIFDLSSDNQGCGPRVISRVVLSAAQICADQFSKSPCETSGKSCQDSAFTGQ